MWIQVVTEYMRFSLHTTEGQRPFGLLADEDDERQYELNSLAVHARFCTSNYE